MVQAIVTLLPNDLLLPETLLSLQLSNICSKLCSM